MSENKTNGTQKVFVGSMVTPAVRKTVEEMAQKKERTISYIASKVLELDPEMIEEYRSILEKQLAAA